MGARGERFLTVKGNEVKILFTNRALAEAEQRMGKAALGVAREMVQGQASVADVAHLLRAGMQAANRDEGLRKAAVSLHDAYAILDEVGFSRGTAAVMEAMTDVLTYSGETADIDPNQ